MSITLADKAEQQSGGNTQPKRSQHKEFADVEADSAHHQKAAQAEGRQIPNPLAFHEMAPS
jgi:hypothetical protein